MSVLHSCDCPLLMPCIPFTRDVESPNLGGLRLFVSNEMSLGTETAQTVGRLVSPDSLSIPRL